jgi:putative DNA primase/helicase
VWSGKAWLTDKTGKVDRTAKKVAQEIFEETKEIEDEGLRKALRAWAVATESRERRNAMIDLAAKEHAVVTLIENYDQDPWLFNLQNGTINLKTAELLPHAPGDMMTKTFILSSSSGCRLITSPLSVAWTGVSGVE